MKLLTDNKIIRASIFILSISGLIASCGIFAKKKSSSGKGSEAGEVSETEKVSDEATAKEEVTNVADSLEKVNVKVRSYQQFYATYALLLGIPSDNQTYKTAYEAVETNLPTTSSVKGFLGSHQLAAVKLASAGCDVAYDLATETERTNKFGIDYSFPDGLGSAFNTENRNLLAKTLISKLWNRDIESIGNDDPDLQTLSTFINESSTDIVPAGSDPTALQIKTVTIGACASVLASAPVSFY
ncbi:MAG: hypothetical protein R3B45_06450 [Bdellovibrionota bacterium]